MEKKIKIALVNDSNNLFLNKLSVSEVNDINVCTIKHDDTNYQLIIFKNITQTDIVKNNIDSIVFFINENDTHEILTDIYDIKIYLSQKTKTNKIIICDKLNNNITKFSNSLGIQPNQITDFKNIIKLLLRLENI